MNEKSKKSSKYRTSRLEAPHEKNAADLASVKTGGQVSGWEKCILTQSKSREYNR